MGDGRGPLKAGDTVEGRYRIVKPLDQGGMGTIYLAEHVLIKRKVAIKVLRPEFATDAEVVERFMNEARAAGTLGHPNIVESTDMGFTKEGVPYIVFEFLEGTLLVDEIYRLGGLTLRRALRIANQIASALHAAHTAGIIHRDLKSENIFLTNKDDRPDHVKVLDFGISRFMEAESDSSGRGVVMGTPEFMAPEQVTTPDKVDRRADIYAVGVILYEMLAARRPFKADPDPQVVLQKVVSEPPPPLAKSEAPPGLSELIIERLLAKDPDRRFQTMKELQAAIEAFYNINRPSNSMTPLSVPIVEAPPPTASSPNLITQTKPVELPVQPKRKRAGWLWLAAAVLAGGAGVAMQVVGRGGSSTSGQQTATNDSATAILQADSEKLANAIDGEVRAAHLRAEGLASSPVVRAGIETDAATIRDLAQNEHIFTPKEGESLQIFQVADGKLRPLVQIPDKAQPVAPVEANGTRLETDGTSITIIAGTPVQKQDGSVGGALALATRMDLGSFKQTLGQHALAATLVGLDKPVVLAESSQSGGTALMVPVPVDKTLKPWPISLQAMVSAPTATATARSGGGSGMVSYAFLGIGGVLLVLYVGTLIRGRREG
jgi:serine/threonine-protein kinase